jgi:Holliday junction resolvasome RuvABC DNA-binding subunit
MTFDRAEVGRKVVETSQNCSEGYMRSFSSQFRTPEDQARDSAAATAASNTGVFILEGLGFSQEEIRDLIAQFRRDPHPHS